MIAKTYCHPLHNVQYKNDAVMSDKRYINVKKLQQNCTQGVIKFLITAIRLVFFLHLLPQTQNHSRTLVMGEYVIWLTPRVVKPVIVDVLDFTNMFFELFDPYAHSNIF